MFYGSNPYRKDNPRWIFSNATDTAWAPGPAIPADSGGWERAVAGLGGFDRGGEGLAGRARRACGIGVAWLIGLPRRAGTRLHAAGDAEARWWHWQVTERWGGLVRQYRDPRFDLLRAAAAPRADGLGAELAGVEPAPPDCPCGDR